LAWARIVGPGTPWDQGARGDGGDGPVLPLPGNSVDSGDRAHEPGRSSEGMLRGASRLSETAGDPTKVLRKTLAIGNPGRSDRRRSPAKHSGEQFPLVQRGQKKTFLSLNRGEISLANGIGFPPGLRVKEDGRERKAEEHFAILALSRSGLTGDHTPVVDLLYNGRANPATITVR